MEDNWPASGEISRDFGRKTEARDFRHTRFKRIGTVKNVARLREDFHDLFLRPPAKEIQVLAMDDGRWVWTRPKYGYKLHDLELHSMKQKYKEWQRRQGIDPPHDATRAADFSKDFLTSDAVNSLTLYETL